MGKSWGILSSLQVWKSVRADMITKKSGYVMLDMNKKNADVAVSYNNNTNRLEKYRQIDDDCQKCRLLNVLVKISRSFYNIQANQYLAYHFFTSKDLKKVFLV